MKFFDGRKFSKMSENSTHKNRKNPTFLRLKIFGNSQKMSNKNSDFFDYFCRKAIFTQFTKIEKFSKKMFFSFFLADRKNLDFHFFSRISENSTKNQKFSFLRLKKKIGRKKIDSIFSFFRFFSFRQLPTLKIFKTYFTTVPFECFWAYQNRRRRS